MNQSEYEGYLVRFLSMVGSIHYFTKVNNNMFHDRLEDWKCL